MAPTIATFEDLSEALVLHKDTIEWPGAVVVTSRAESERFLSNMTTNPGIDFIRFQTHAFLPSTADFDEYAFFKRFVTHFPALKTCVVSLPGEERDNVLNPRLVPQIPVDTYSIHDIYDETWTLGQVEGINTLKLMYTELPNPFSLPTALEHLTMIDNWIEFDPLVAWLPQQLKLKTLIITAEDTINRIGYTEFSTVWPTLTTCRVTFDPTLAFATGLLRLPKLEDYASNPVQNLTLATSMLTQLNTYSKEIRTANFGLCLAWLRLEDYESALSTFLEVHPKLKELTLVITLCNVSDVDRPKLLGKVFQSLKFPIDDLNLFLVSSGGHTQRFLNDLVQPLFPKTRQLYCAVLDTVSLKYYANKVENRMCRQLLHSFRTRKMTEIAYLEKVTKGTRLETDMVGSLLRSYVDTPNFKNNPSDEPHQYPDETHNFEISEDELGASEQQLRSEWRTNKRVFLASRS